MKISRKEVKESRYWLRLVETNGEKELEKERLKLEEESKELLKILSSILVKTQ